MKKIFLARDEYLQEEQLERTGAFDAKALVAAADIIEQVKERGDDALRELTLKFDHVEIDEFRVPEDEYDSALHEIPVELFDALSYAADRIAAFHEGTVPKSTFDCNFAGVMLGTRVTPIENVGIYVPGGRAKYPSTVLMNAIAAQAAGVDKVIMCSPPGQDGHIDPAILAAANISGVSEVYRVGGAQAIAAMAYGTKSVPKVDKITGPGNAYVAAAKKCVFGDVGVDMIAGPSEVCVMADFSASPRYVAIDLMAQAEHDPQARCYLVTQDEEFVDEVLGFIDEYLESSTRADITRQSLEGAVAVICESVESAISAVNTIAPEHLELFTYKPMNVFEWVRNAGAVFFGPHTPESCGDYVAGPNHTLPTGGTARFSSPLSSETFTKKTNMIMYDFYALMQDADTIRQLASCEGLWAHNRAVEIRKELFSEVISQLEEDSPGYTASDALKELLK